MIDFVNNFIHRIRLSRYTHGRIKKSKELAKNKGAMFGQEYEDAVVKILLGRIKSFIDIGANDGLTFSNSFYFAEMGAVGLCFEPLPSIYKILRKVHGSNPHVICINEAIANNSDGLTIYEDGYHGLLSTSVLSSKNSEILRSINVSTNTLNFWIRRYIQFNEVDLLSIDVEGAEMSVLEGIDFESFKTKLLIIEIDNPSEAEALNIHLLLSNAKYRLFARNSHNAFYVSRDIAVSDEMRLKVSGLSSSFKIYL